MDFFVEVRRSARPNTNTFSSKPPAWVFHPGPQSGSTLPGRNFVLRCEMKFPTTALFLLALAAAPLTRADQTPQQLAAAELPSLLTIYKDLHMHPELSTHEERSASIVAKELKAAGCEVTERVGKYEKPGRDLLWRHRRDEERRGPDRANPDRSRCTASARRNRR